MEGFENEWNEWKMVDFDGDEEMIINPVHNCTKILIEAAAL